MSCLNPIQVVNPSKYVSLHYKDRYLLQVPCGTCAECQKMVSNQWNYRTYYEFADCLRSSGFIYFDTLSYNRDSLPRINDFLDDAIKPNFSCFNKKHITDFLKRIRINVERKRGIKLRYFLSTEYGHDKVYFTKSGQVRRGTNRPHYHILFFVYGNIDPCEFSRMVASAWPYGLTDGIPYKSSSYVYSHNTIATNSLENILRTADYITKYVQKSCEFKATIDKRVNVIMRHYANKFSPSDEEKWLSSPAAARIRRKLNSIVNQFHRQSLHYGESALSELDIAQLFEDGYLLMPHNKAVKVKVALPTYYKRKLFYRLVEIDGTRSWQLNEDGLRYQKYRYKKLRSQLESQFQCVCIEHKLNYDCRSLAEYVLNDRGRIKAFQPSESIEQKLQKLSLFNYVTMTDKENLLVCGLTPTWCGNQVLGYKYDVMPPYMTIKDFISKYVILDSNKEKELSHIYYLLSFIDKGKQQAYELKQKLRQLYKSFV